MDVCIATPTGSQKPIFKDSKFGFNQYRDTKCSSSPTFQVFPGVEAGKCQQISSSQEEYQYGARSQTGGALTSIQELINKYTGHEIVISTKYTSNTCKVKTGFDMAFYDGCMQSFDDNEQPTDTYIKYKFSSTGLTVSMFSTSSCNDANPPQNFLPYDNMDGFNKCEKTEDSNEYQIVTPIFPFIPTSKPTFAPTYLKGNPTPIPTIAPTLENFEYIEVDYFRGPDCQGPLFSVNIMSTGKCLRHVNESTHNVTGTSFKRFLRGDEAYEEEYSDSACRNFVSKSPFLGSIKTKQCVNINQLSADPLKSVLITGLHSEQNELKKYNTSIIHVGYAAPGCNATDISTYTIAFGNNGCQGTSDGQGIKQSCNGKSIRTEFFNETTCTTSMYAYDYNATCSLTEKRNLYDNGEFASNAICV